MKRAKSTLRDRINNNHILGIVICGKHFSLFYNMQTFCDIRNSIKGTLR